MTDTSRPDGSGSGQPDGGPAAGDPTIVVFPLRPKEEPHTQPLPMSRMREAIEIAKTSPTPVRPNSAPPRADAGSTKSAPPASAPLVASGNDNNGGVPVGGGGGGGGGGKGSPPLQ